MSLFEKIKQKLPPAPIVPPDHTIQRANLLLLVCVVGVTAFSHVVLGHTIIVVYGVVVWAIKTIIILRDDPPPARWLVVALTILSFLLVLILYGGWNGQRAGISFLTLLVSLKYLESNSLRDYLFVCLILLFLAACSFLFFSSITSVLFVLLFTIATLTVTLLLSSATPLDNLTAFKPSTAIVLKALPIAVMLFFFFPRISSNFGFIPSLDRTDNSSLDNALIAGDFASSAFSDEPAFRVEFKNATPARRQLYWRVKTMVEERQFSWQLSQPTPNQLQAARSRSIQKNNTPAGSLDGIYSEYDIIHVPSKDSYVPFLDYAYKPSIGTQLDDLSVYTAQPKSSGFRYTGLASSQPSVSESVINGELQNVALYLQTTSQPSERATALINRWLSTANSHTQLVDVVFNYYRNNGFTYTLQPPSLGDNPMDTFLFETKSGYCEHYASSFAILMRWLGVPSRIIVGFQGGTENTIGNYLQVRYSDAHAWTEVWLDGQWRRVDPTAAAALGEQRITQGMAPLLNLWNSQGWQAWDRSGALSDFIQPSNAQQTWKNIVDTWNNLSYQWDKWVINYDFKAQSSLLNRLGVDQNNRLAVLLGVMAFGMITIIGFYSWQLAPKPTPLNPLQRVYQRFLTKLQRKNITKLNSETPYEFAQRAAKKFPNQAKQIHSITQHYVELTYGKPQQAPPLHELKQAVRLFTPKAS